VNTGRLSYRIIPVLRSGALCENQPIVCDSDAAVVGSVEVEKEAEVYGV
jgi:hypothetical protein